MRLHRILSRTYAEGPGCRFCIWVQGCAHHCPGYFATELWSYNGGRAYAVEQVIAEFNAVKDTVCGITFLGGEPFDQAEDLAVVAKAVKELNKNVITFTGYTFEELNCAGNPSYQALLQTTDVLIDGRFQEQNLETKRPLVGSANQRFLFLTDAIPKQEIEKYMNRFELRTDKNGEIIFNGMGNIHKLKKFIRNLEGTKNEKI